MSLTLTEEEIHGLIAYARGKFAAEPYPSAPGAAADPLVLCTTQATRRHQVQSRVS